MGRDGARPSRGKQGGPLELLPRLEGVRSLGAVLVDASFVCRDKA